MFHKPAFPVAAWFCAMFVWFASPAVAQAPPNPLVVAVATAPKSLDPALATDAAGARLLQLTNPALLRWDDTYTPVGLVAEGCTQKAARITCILPAGEVFHDGTPLTAHAVKTWLEFVRNTPQSPLAALLAPVQGMVAHSNTMLEITLQQPTLGFMGALADIPLAVPPSATTLGQPRAGAGAYRLAAHDALGNVTLAAADNRLPSLLFTPLADATTRLLKLKKGEVDVVLNDIPPELFGWARQHGYGMVATPSSSYSYLAVNFTNPYLADGRIRRALASALDRAAIRHYLLGGMAAPAGSLLPPNHPAAYQAAETERDVFAAEDLLDAAGTLGDSQNPRFSLTLATSTDALSQRVALVLQQQLREAGVELKLETLEWAAFYDNVKAGRFDLALMNWSGELAPEFLVQVFHSAKVPPAGLNRGRVNIPVLDAALNRLASATTPAEQLAAAQTAQRLQEQTLPYIPLYRRHHTLVTRPGITGCTLPAGGGYQGLTTCRK